MATPKKITLAIFGALAVTLTAGVTPAHAKRCDDLPVSAPTIRINVEFRSPTIRTNVSKAKLRQFHEGPANPMGLTKIAYVHRVGMGVNFQPMPGGKGGCYEPSVVKIDIIVGPVMVYLASELKSSSCAYRVTLAHENQHVDNTREALQRYTPRLRNDILAALPKWMQPARSGRDGARKLQAKLEPIVAKMMKAMTGDAHEKDAAMDTPQAYAAESRKCSDWPR